MRLEWSARAARDLEHEYQYAKADNGEANAAALLRYIAKAVEHVRLAPLTGRTGRVLGTREYVVQNTALLLFYRVRGDVLRIERVYPAHRRPPKRV